MRKKDALNRKVIAENIEKSAIELRIMHYIFTKLRAFIDYTGNRRPLTFRRDYAGHKKSTLLPVMWGQR